MRRLVSAVVLCLLTASFAGAAPKVAVVYSTWGEYAFRDEFDPHLKALGWTCEKFENKDMAQLAPRLGEFDVVISAGVGNYEHTVDMAPYQAQWLKWLEDGGLLLLTDASYPSVLDQWPGRFGPDFVVTSTTCAAHRRDKANPDLRVYDPKNPILHVPHELPPLLEKKSIWGHLETWDKSYTSLVTCADTKSLLLYRDVGKGCLAISSFFSFRGAVDTPVASGLLENLWFHVQGVRSGLALTEFTLGEALPGAHTLRLGLTPTAGATGGQCQVRLEVQPAGGPAQLAAAMSVGATATAGATMTMGVSYQITQRGPVTFRLTLDRPQAEPLVIERQQVIPPLLSLAVGNRHFYPWHKALPFTAAFAPEADNPLDKCRAEALVDGKVLAALPKLDAQMPGTVPLTGLAVGEHKLELRLLQGDKLLDSQTQAFSTHPTPRIYVRPEDLTTLVDGKPFFPLGFYHVSWPFPAEDRLQFLREVAAAGFNTVHASLKQMDEWDPFLAEAEKLDMKVITEFGVDMVAAIQRYRDRKAVLAWNPGDEPDGGGVPPEVMLERHNRIKDADANVPTYMTLCVPAAYQRYAAMAEVIAPDPYPIHHRSASTVPVYTMISQAVAAATPLGRPIWAIPQAFGYKETTSWRVPTFAEERNMTYLALLAGAKGLIYYTYRDTGFDMREHPELWAGMKTLPGEINTLEPWLLAGTRGKLETGLPDVFAGLWISGERQALCVVNTAPQEARQVSIQVPEGVKGQVVNLFPTHPASLRLIGDRLLGEIGPLEVQVYEVK